MPKYKVTVTHSYWVNKVSVNYVEGENIDTAMEQGEKDYEDEVLDFQTVTTDHHGTDWGIETLKDLTPCYGGKSNAENY